GVFGFTPRGYPRGAWLSRDELLPLLADLRSLARPQPGHRETRPGLRLLPVDRPLELGLRHLRAALDPHCAGLVVDLVARAALRPVRPRTEAAAAPGRNVLTGEPGRLLRLARPRPLLVDGAGGDLLRRALRRAALLQAFLDVLVLTLALCAPGLLRHDPSSLGLRLAGLLPLLVDGSRGDFLGALVRAARLFLALLDVLVLTFALVGPRLRHDSFLSLVAVPVPGCPPPYALRLGFFSWRSGQPREHSVADMLEEPAAEATASEPSKNDVLAE